MTRAKDEILKMRYISTALKCSAEELKVQHLPQCFWIVANTFQASDQSLSSVHTLNGRSQTPSLTEQNRLSAKDTKTIFTQ